MDTLKINDAFSLNQDLQRCEDKNRVEAITVKGSGFGFFFVPFGGTIS